MSDRVEAAVRALVDALRDELHPAAVPDGPDPLLTMEQTRAALGGIARSTLYVEIDAGRLRTILIGRRRFCTASGIADYIAGAMTARP